MKEKSLREENRENFVRATVLPRSEKGQSFLLFYSVLLIVGSTLRD